jgi:hypothetical protein
MTMRILALSIAVVGGIAAANCNPYSPDLGATPYTCPDGICPADYTCTTTTDMPPKDKVCVAKGGNVPDAGSGGGFQCADDSSVEQAGRNDTIQTAFQTPVASQMMMLALAGLAICPEGDKDNYAIDITVANQNLEVISSWDSGQPVNVSILNAGGTSIGNGLAMGTMAMRACVPNLPVGKFFASTFAATGVKNNYRLSIKIVPNC